MALGEKGHEIVVVNDVPLGLTYTLTILTSLDPNVVRYLLTTR
jgi:hypothetical protein